MQQSGEYRIAAPRDAVWRALNDPEVLARCVEGCESLTRVAEDAFEAKVRARVGPVSALFTADIKLEDVNAPASYTLRGGVKGGAAGFAKGAAKVTLAEAGQETVLRYDVEGSIGGKLAQVGQRLVDAAARKMADDFFAAFSADVAPVGAAAPAPKPSAWRGEIVIWLAVAALAAAVIFGLTLAR